MPKRWGMWEDFPNSKQPDISTRSLTKSKIFYVSIDMKPQSSCGKAEREKQCSYVKGLDCETQNRHIKDLYKETKESDRYKEN